MANKNKVHENEVARAFKTVNDTYIEPISFIVPRRAEVFQTDIYPPTIGIKAAMSSAEWFGGKTAVPPLISLKNKYEGGEADEVSAAKDIVKEAPAAKPTTPTAEEETKPKAPVTLPTQETVAKIATVVPKGEIKDNKQAMADMASKFADKPNDEDAASSSDSSFEEVTRPVERYPRSSAVRATAPTPSSSLSKSTPVPSSAKPIAATVPTVTTLPVSTSTTTSEPTTTTPAPSSGTAGPTDGLKGHLSDIKASQASMASQVSELKLQVGELTELVKQLTGRLDGLAGGQAERIRRVELELEELRE
jgi:coronin-1B/1C/6